jgi:prepilin-type N-terminal cleavage/methylation domain-containing protein
MEFMTRRTCNKRKPGEAGFTMLEVLAAIAILCFGLLAVASMQTGAIQGNYTGRLQTEATTWAQDRLEKLLALPYGHVDLADTNDQYISMPASFPDAPDEYDIKYLVDEDYPITDAKLIRVRVQWTDKGFTRENVLTTVKPDV